jgi:hypothetical protein
MSMIRSIRRNIVRNRGESWEHAQKRRYGTNYCAVSHSGMRKSSRHGRIDPLPKAEPASVKGLHIAAREAIRNRLNMHPVARNREKAVNDDD